MVTYTGLDHVKAAYKRKFTDRIPYYPITGACGAKLIDRSVKEFLTEPEVLAQTQLAMFERFQPDVVVMLADLLMEAEALGATLVFPDDAICQAQSLLLQDKGKLGALSVPDPHRDGRMPYFLEACRQVASEIKTAAVGGTICGPWAIAVGLRGAENLIMDTMDDPDFVQELMQFCTAVTRSFAQAVKSTGVGVSLSEAPASCSLISPQIYQTFIKSYHQQLVEEFQQQRTGLTLHVCGYVDPIRDDLLACGFAALSIDQPSSLEHMLQAAEQKTVIIGNVATTAFLADEQELRREVQRCVKAAQGRTAYILASGCELPLPTTADAILKFKEICDQLCRYDDSETN